MEYLIIAIIAAILGAIVLFTYEKYVKKSDSIDKNFITKGASFAGIISVLSTIFSQKFANIQSNSSGGGNSTDNLGDNVIVSEVTTGLPEF